MQNCCYGDGSDQDAGSIGSDCGEVALVVGGYHGDGYILVTG